MGGGALSYISETYYHFAQISHQKNKYKGNLEHSIPIFRKLNVLLIR